jgi:hypothetical protein
MTFSGSVKYSTEGAPMFIGDVGNAQHWNGRKDDGSGIIVQYWGSRVETLPKEFAQTKKPGGKRRKKFANADDAAAFERELLKHLMRLYPGAAKDPKIPDYPFYFVDDERVFGIERQFTSALASVLKKLKGDIAIIVFDKKHKAQALFFDMEGGGPGVIATDPSSSAFVVAKITTGNDDDGHLLRTLERTSLTKLKPKGQIKLSDRVVIFDSAFAAADLALLNWGTRDIGVGVEQALRSTSLGPIRVPDQQPAGGAFLLVQPDSYHYAVVGNDRAGSATYNALWLWRS